MSGNTWDKYWLPGLTKHSGPWDTPISGKTSMKGSPICASCVLTHLRTYSSSMHNPWSQRPVSTPKKVMNSSSCSGSSSWRCCWITPTRPSHSLSRILRSLPACSPCSNPSKTTSSASWSSSWVKDFYCSRRNPRTPWPRPRSSSTTRRRRHWDFSGRKCRSDSKRQLSSEHKKVSKPPIA